MDRNKNNSRFVLDENKKNERLGQIQYNNKGTLMKIVEYNNSRNVIVEFQDEYKIKVKKKKGLVVVAFLLIFKLNVVDFNFFVVDFFIA